MPPDRRAAVPPHRRLGAWIYTGPLGHLYGMSADIAAAWMHWGAGLARERFATRSGRSSRGA